MTFNVIMSLLKKGLMMSKTYIESLDKKMVFAIEDIQFIIYVKTGHNDKEHDHVKIKIANEHLPPMYLFVPAPKKDYDKELTSWYDGLKKMMQIREVKALK